MIKDLVSGLLVVAIAVGIGMSFARSGVKAMKKHEESSVKRAPLPPVQEAARYWKNKRPLQAGINCFGATVSAFGVSPIPHHASAEELKAFLGASCRELASTDLATAFDVGVIYDGNNPAEAAHSFIMLTPTISYYKDGVEAETLFKVDMTRDMLKTFRVGFTKKKCDELLAAATEESGLPCPGVVKRYRCKANSTFKWKPLDRAEELLYAITLKRAQPLASDLEAVDHALRSLGKEDALALLSGIDAPNRLLLRERVRSLDGFFGYYADRNAWGEPQIRRYRDTLRGLIGKL